MLNQLNIEVESGLAIADRPGHGKPWQNKCPGSKTDESLSPFATGEGNGALGG